MRQLFLFCLLAAFLWCSSDLPFEPAGPNSAPDPSAFGPFSVGVQTRIEYDYARTAPDGVSPRKLVTEIWYPSLPAEGSANLESYNVKDVLPAELLERLDGVTITSFPTDAIRDAEPNTDHGPYPVILFSHGSLSIRFQSTFLTVYLASHGYVVISPDHQGNTFAELSDGNSVEIEDQVQSLVDRPDDLIYYLDRYPNLSDSDSLSGLIDWERVGVSGHSFGAVTTLRAAGLDDRIDAIVPQCPAGYSLTWLDIERPLASLEIPIMVQMAQGDMTTPPEMAESIWENVTAPGYYLRLETAGHFTYSDLCTLGTDTVQQVEAAGIGGGLISDGCNVTNLSSEEGLPLIRNYTIGFFNHYLRNSPGSLVFLDEEKAKSWTQSSVQLLTK
ncbi:MAG: acetylxylan esterase [Myxococcota bacterium]|nr:acetylxylan esterase [Myxococcota bacterium]